MSSISKPTSEPAATHVQPLNNVSLPSMTRTKRRRRSPERRASLTTGGLPAGAEWDERELFRSRCRGESKCGARMETSQKINGRRIPCPPARAPGTAGRRRCLTAATTAMSAERGRHPERTVHPGRSSRPDSSARHTACCSSHRRGVQGRHKVRRCVGDDERAAHHAQADDDDRDGQGPDERRQHSSNGKLRNRLRLQKQPAVCGHQQAEQAPLKRHADHRRFIRSERLYPSLRRSPTSIDTRHGRILSGFPIRAMVGSGVVMHRASSRIRCRSARRGRPPPQLLRSPPRSRRLHPSSARAT